MEVLAEFDDDQGFNVKLTKDKIFVSSLGNEETFALRGVNGVGLYDDIVKYNEELEQHKTQKNPLVANICIGSGAFIVMCSLYLFSKSDAGAPMYIAEGIVFLAIGVFLKKQVHQPPKLDSFFKLILSGSDRKFKFDKNDATSASIADFINKIEETLTAYK